MDKKQKLHYFIDESGDPAFYATGKRSLVNKEGFKPLLLLGMVKIDDKKATRNAILNFIENIKSDPLYNTLPCVKSSKGWYLHASYDNLEIQMKFTEFLRNLKGFEFYCVIGRKILDLFHKKHNSNDSEFYFDMIYHLLKNRLTEENKYHQVFLAARKKNTQNALNDSIKKAIEKDNNKRSEPTAIHYNCEIVQSKLTPELSIVDYLLWALQRYILKGEDRFFKALEKKYTLIIDLYDFEKYHQKNFSNHYDSKNVFRTEKAAKFRTNGYE